MTSHRAHARTQWDWLRRVQADLQKGHGGERPLSHGAFALAFTICDHVNARDGTAWPSQQRLAGLLGVDVRTVRRLTAELQSREHLEVVHGRQHEPNTYRLADAPDRTQVSSLEALRPDMDVRPEPIQTGQISHPDRTFLALQTGHGCPPNRLRNRLIEPMPVSPAAKAAPASPVSASSPSAVIPSQEADLYRRGKEILGRSAGGLISNLLRAKGGSIAQARAAIEQASEKADAREYIGAIIRGRNSPDDLRTRGDAW